MSISAPSVTRTVNNFIGGKEAPPSDGGTFEKLAPSTGEPLSRVARSGSADVDAAITAAIEAQPEWSRRTAVERGAILRRVAAVLERDRDLIARVVAEETGKSPRDAKGETEGAIEMGYFVAGEGRRFYGRTTTSAVPNRHAMIVRQPVGIAGLIIAANTPIANVAWKVFPCLLCGNGAILKASEDAPETALMFARLAVEAGVPPGILNVVQGYGEEAGWPLVEDERVDLISFTGSSAVGRAIAARCGDRLAKVCLELGGKNAFVVCDDADLPRAADAAALSAFSNAGQRCSSGSRIIVFAGVYERFRELLLERAAAQSLGSSDEDDYGPVINGSQLEFMEQKVAAAVSSGAKLLCGGTRLDDDNHRGGFYMPPTLIEDSPLDDGLSQTELFGPISILHRVRDFEEAVSATNASPYGLTAAIWTQNLHRAQEFIARVRTGVASVNGPTYGSEPHLPFGGLRQSGTGWREAGTEALDVYSEWKTVYVVHDPSGV